MVITDIRLNKVDSAKVKAVASITFDECFVVTDVKVIENNKGLFVAMPSKRNSDGTFQDVAHPINTETRLYIQNSVLEEYNKQN